MNREEAKQTLHDHLAPYKEWPYARLLTLVGGEHVSRVRGPSGKEYFFEVYVSPVNECDPTLCIEGYVFEVEGRRWLPPNEHAEFSVACPESEQEA